MNIINSNILKELSKFRIKEKKKHTSKQDKIK